MFFALAGTLGCAAKGYPLPMTAAELSGYGEAAALVAYLSQPAASASVCDLHAQGPHLSRLDDDTRKALDGGLRDGKIAPGLWSRCMAALLQAADPRTATALVDDVLQAALDTIHDPHLEFDAGLQARVDALQQVYLERGAGLAATPDTVDRGLSLLQRDVDRKGLGPVGQRRAEDLLAMLNLERAQWQGHPMDAQVMDALQEAGDERTLRWAIARLPGEPLRAEARRRVIRLHLRASPFPEVRQRASTVEDAVMRSGANPVSLADHAPVRGWLDPSVASAQEVLVEQRLPEQSARLLGYSSDRPTPSLLPELPTRGSLHVELRGIPRPVTVCAPASELDVTPCLPPGEVRLDTPLASIDRDGVLHFTDSITEAVAVTLARRGRRLSLPFVVAGRRVAALDWPLSFATPADLILVGASAGSPGPDLEVEVDARDPGYLVYSVSNGWRLYQAVVERNQARSFHVVSRGATGSPGASGSPGWDGSAGADGSSASCPSFPASDGSRGGDGSPGGDGGPGGAGGAGGNIRVKATASVAAREEMLRVLVVTMLSEGGPGGPGGSGGAGGSGGPGGRGGSGASCHDSDGHVTFLSGGLDGMSGSDGLSGSNGPPGRPGPPGRVSFSFVP